MNKNKRSDRMSTHHSGTVTLKPVSEMAKYLKNLIPANIPETYALKPIFKKVANEENIRKGVIAFRDFLFLLCEFLIKDGHLYARPPKNPTSITDYPFIHNITNLLVEIGYHSKLAKDGKSLLITEMPLCTASIDEKGKKKSPKIPFSGQIECLRFLSLCGFAFTGIDLEAKTLNASQARLAEVSYPNNPILLTGLKALSIADMELRTTRRYWNDNNLLRCDYRLMKAEQTDILDVLKDFLHPLPARIQKFALKLHQRYIDMGMTCVMTILSDVNFAYSFINKSRRVLSSRDIYTLSVWQFSYSIRFGYCLVVRAKKTDKYADVIKKFPLSLQKIIAKGYGCDRKLRNERCQHGCQGIRIPLDDSILNTAKDIETWLDNEVKY
jgi:hypothetical protein